MCKMIEDYPEGNKRESTKIETMRQVYSSPSIRNKYRENNFLPLDLLEEGKQKDEKN